MLDSEVDGVRIVLTPADPPPPPAPLPELPGFPDDEFAMRTPLGGTLAFLREPVARCHYDRLMLTSGQRRVERPLPPWVYYERHLAVGARLLLGGCRQAWIVDWDDGAMTEIFSEPDADGVQVCWLDENTAVAAGYRSILITGVIAGAMADDRRVTLPCARAVAALAVSPRLLVVSDDNGAQWILDGRVVARDWRTIMRAHGGVVVGAGGDAFRVSVSAG